MRVVLPNDPIPAAFPGIFYWYRHTCEPGSQNEFVCYDDSMLPFLTHSIGAYLDGVAKSKKIIIQERLKNCKAKARRMIFQLAKLGARRLGLDQDSSRMQTTDGSSQKRIRRSSILQDRISAKKKLRNGKKY